MTKKASDAVSQKIFLVAVLLAVAVAATSYYLHTGASLNLLYLAILVLCFSSPDRNVILKTAGLVTILCIAGEVVGTRDWNEDQFTRITNLVTTIFAIWTTAILGYQRMSWEEQLRTANSELDQRIQDRTNELQAAVSSLEQEIERRKAAQAAFENEKLLIDGLLEVIPDNIYFKDREGKYLRINQAKARRSGLSSTEDAIGKTDYDFFPKEHADKARAEEERILQTGEGLIDVEEQLVWPDGNVTWVSATKMPLRSPDGSIVGTMGISRDMTQHHAIAAQLEQERDRLRTLVDHLPDFVFIKDFDGRFVVVNQTFVEMYGCQSEEELLGKNDFDFSPPELAQAYREDDLQVMMTRTPLINREEENLLADGSRKWLLTTKVPLTNSDNEVVGLVGIARDITKRKKAEQELKAAKEAAEVANRAKSEFLANMSHEIRTPMNAIIGMSELVLDTELSPQQRDYLETVLGSAESLLGIINDILDFSKIESGLLVLESYAIDLREWLGDSIKPLALRAHSKKLELAFHVAPEVPPFVRGDGLRLRQVIVNLLGNAIKFTERGEVVLDVSVEESADNEMLLHFAVSDTGVGMSTDAQERVFRAFEQADMSTTRKFGGTGLGLAISSKLVELMGGEIWVESELGRGSTFHFTARFKPSTKDDVPKSLRNTASLENLKVLIVDDNETNRKILMEMCSNWRMRPTAVESAAQAVEMLSTAFAEGSPFELVITDASMPDVDGFTLAQQICDDTRLGSTIVMMLTSLDRTDDIHRCEELGIRSYLTKPIKQSDLFDAIMASVHLDVDDVAEPTESHTGNVQQTRPLQILLAEDSQANQKLAVGLLSKWGHQVTVANNGQEAVDAVKSQTFDIVLMDVQMPELDGLQATGVIRELQARQEIPKFPIVAMTAHAMKGDRERCLESGMDEYVSKPIRPTELATVLAGFFETLAATSDVIDEAPAPQAQASDSTSSAPEAASLDANETAAAKDVEAQLENPRPTGETNVPNAIDWNVLLKNAHGDEELARDVAEAFLEETPGIFQNLGTAIHEKNRELANRSSHTMKSSLSTMGSAGSEFAKRIEQASHAEDWNACASEYASLAEIFPHVVSELQSKLDGTTS